MDVNKNNEIYNKKAEELVSMMTLEEKVGLCSGLDCWTLKAVERLGLDSVSMMDGPHGLRYQIGATDNLGLGKSKPAVCFPTASALACSFDQDLVYRIGEALGETCIQEEVAVILGPGANMKRSPLCGRNFEYFSEDPLLSGKLAAGMIRGIQSTGTGASLKHFAVNNQEKRRMTIDAIVDERALREVYLKAFEIAVKEGKPDTVMCAYNRLDGTYCSENKNLLHDILREEWGYEGLVVSDWGAVHDRVLGLEAGLDLEMPGNHGYNDKKIMEAMNNGSLSTEVLDRAVVRVTSLILKGLENKNRKKDYDGDRHHKLAVEAAEQSAVLVKNQDNLLPGKKHQNVAVIGAFAKTPRYQGAGSSKVNPLRLENAWDTFLEYGVNASYASGYHLKSNNKDKNEAELIREACNVAKDKDIVYLFVGLPEGYETEGADRQTLMLPLEQNRLVEAVCGVNPNVAVVLMGGAPMELPWINLVKSVLICYLSGEGAGRAAVNLLLGRKVPSGKLAETWPMTLGDSPSYHNFPGERRTVEYRESIYVGYRYYEKAGKSVLFPFGHGLSYTKFTYSDLSIDKKRCQFGDKVSISFTIANCGNIPGKETALVFVGHKNKEVFTAKKELKEFVKVEIEPGERKLITIILDTKEFAYYNTCIHDWYAESGIYQIMVGSSSADCPLEIDLELESDEKPQPNYQRRAPIYYELPEGEFIVPQNQFEALYGKRLPIGDYRASRPYRPENTLEDISHTLLGKVLIRYADSVMKKALEAEEGQEGMMNATVREMPLYAMVAAEELPENFMEAILDLLNGHFIEAICKAIKG